MHFSVRALEEIIDELPVHLFGQDSSILLILVAAKVERFINNSTTVNQIKEG
jgi:hypothetical protein